MDGIFSPSHIILVLVAALIIFGPKRLPDIGKSLGKGIREFKGALTHIGDDHEAETAPTPTQAVAQAPAPPAGAVPAPPAVPAPAVDAPAPVEVPQAPANGSPTAGSGPTPTA